jgi:hypothetical protein
MSIRVVIINSPGSGPVGCQPVAAVFVDDAACDRVKCARPYQAEKWVYMKCFCCNGSAGAYRAGFISKGQARTPVAMP